MNSVLYPTLLICCLAAAVQAQPSDAFASRASAQPDTLWLAHTGGGRFIELRACRVSWAAAEFDEVAFDQASGRFVVSGRLTDWMNDRPLGEMRAIIGTLREQEQAAPTITVAGSRGEGTLSEGGDLVTGQQMRVSLHGEVSPDGDFALSFDSVDPDSYITFIPVEREDGSMSLIVSALYRVGGLPQLQP